MFCWQITCRRVVSLVSAFENFLRSSSPTSGYLLEQTFSCVISLVSVVTCLTDVQEIAKFMKNHEK